MELQGEYRLDASLQDAWNALLNPACIEAALPDCESFVETAPGKYDVVMRVGIGAIKGSFRGSVAVSDERPPDAYKLSVTGAGKPGRVKGIANISLREQSGATAVTYVADVTAQGTLARLGSRLLRGAARLLAARFFESMNEQIAKRAA